MDISDSEEGGENEHPDTRLNGRFQQMLQQQSHLGIGETQNAVDFRSQKRKDNSDLYRYIYKTREDGRVIDRRTGELIPGYSYDDTLIDTAIGADQLMEQNSDCQFAAETAGYANLPTTAFTNPGTPRRFQMLEKNLRDVLIEDRKRRAVSIATRGELITGLEEQQHELYTLSQRLSAMYLSMAPTVKRWYWLGSMTGYMPRAAIQMDADVAILSDDKKPVPYWLLTRYVRRQYQEHPLVLSYAKDQRYWEAQSHLTLWCDDLLRELDEKINHLVSLTDEQQRTATYIYLFIRDAVISQGLQLRAPERSGLPAVDANARNELDRHAWVQHLPTDTLIGRYEGLLRAASLTRDTVLEVIKPSEIKVRAVTGDEARPVNADAFPLMRDAERLETRGEDGFKSVRIGEVFQDLCLATMPLLTPPVGGGAALLDIKDLVDDSPATFEEWAGAVFKLSDAAIMQSHTGLSLDGLANWTQLLRSVLTSNYLAPALVVGVLPTREHLTDWLFETWPQLTEMEGLAHFSVRFGVAYVRGPVTPALFSTVPSAIRDNLIAYLLTWEDRPAPGILLPRNAPELEQFRTDFDIARGAVQLVVRTRADVVGPLPGYPMHFMYVNLEGLPTPLLEAWQDIDTRLTENFVIDIATGVNHPAGLTGIASNLRRTIASYILWSYMLSDDDIRLAFLDALKNDMLLGTIDIAKRYQDLINTRFMTRVTTQVLPMLLVLAEDEDVVGNFHKELFRSTFISPYRLENIHETAPVVPGVPVPPIAPAAPVVVVPPLPPPIPIVEAVGHGVVRKRRDILATYEFTRADSDNDTIFTETWEKLYANFFHDAWHDPAVARTAAYWRTILRGFCTIALADMETEIAAANGVLRRSIFHYFWTKLRETSSRYLPQHLLPQGGVPPMGQLQLAITAFGQDPGSEALVYQSTFKSLLLAFGEHYWNPDIVPDYLYEPDVLEDKDDASERLPVMELFHAMLIYVVAFFPYVSQHLASRLGLLNHSLREAHDVIRAIAANDPTHGMREARDLIAQLYIPERQYEMQAMLTGRVVFNGMFLSALHDAYRTLQRMATRHTPQPGLWKRSRFEGDNDVYSYAAYADVPMDILTCNTDPNPGPAGGGPTRPYIDTQRTSASVIMQLRTAMAQLVAQHIFKIRFNAPDAYKTTAQYARAPIELQTAQHAMLPFSFTDLGNHAWAVTLT